MSADPETAAEPLDGWHRRHGASWRDDGGLRLVAGYGDPASELALLGRSCGLAERRWIEAFDVTGEDRGRFLNGYVTCDVAALEPGAGAPGFFTDVKGGILADAVITACAAGLRVAVPAGRARALIAHLGRYVLADRVELAAREDLRQLLVAGPGAGELVAQLAPEEPVPWSLRAATVAGRPVEIQRQRDLGAPVYVLWASAADAAVVADELTTRGAEPVGFDALESLRILAGVARYGVDFDDSRFPQETGLDDAVSYTKGCYLGQEVVARIHYRGHVNHALRGLRGAGATLPPSGAALEYEGQEVGRLGSVTRSPATGEAVGLAILHRKAAAIGTEVAVAGSSPGREAPLRVEEPGFALAAAGG